MCSLLTTLGVLLLVTAGNVTCADDFDFTCPDEWKEGTVERLVCTIPLNKLTTPSPCNSYNNIVDFNIVTGAGGASACSVNDPTCSNTNVGVNQCGCQELNASHVTFVYKVNATKNLHENIRWDCAPQCLDSNLDPAITARNTSQCFQTKFETTTTATPTTTAKVPPEPGVLEWWKILLIVAGIAVVISAAGGTCYAVWKYHQMNLYSTVKITKEDLKPFETEGVTIDLRVPTNDDKKVFNKKYPNKELQSVITIGLLSKDRKMNKERIEGLINKKSNGDNGKGATGNESSEQNVPLDIKS